MKKSLLALLLLPLLLGSCDQASLGGDSSNPNGSDGTGEHTKIEEDDDGENEEEHHTQQDYEEEKYPLENDEYRPENPAISLDEWVNYEFHEGHYACYPDEWDFYFGDSYKPNGPLWDNPNQKVDYSGVDFKDKNMFLVSPALQSYPKIEVRLEIWFNSHTSGNYKAKDNQPTFIVKEFDEESTLLNTDTVDFKRSDVPTNNTVYEKKFYIRQPEMLYFILKLNNFVPNGNSGYSPVLTRISLKGFQYE